jgi:hypothetical protein
MGLFDTPNAAFAALESRVAALEAGTVTPPVEPPVEPDWTARTSDLLIRTGDVIEYTRWTGPGPASSLIGMYGTGINGATLRHLEMTGCAYGAKFGGGAVSRNLDCSDWVSRNCDQGLYLGCVEDSTFERLAITAYRLSTSSPGNHCLYVERANKRLTFRDLILGGQYVRGWALQVYMDSTAASDRCSDLLFERVTIGTQAYPVLPMCIYRTDRATVKDATVYGKSGEACFRVVDSTAVRFENVDAFGGDAFLENSGSQVTKVNCTWNGNPV